MQTLDELIEGFRNNVQGGKPTELIYNPHYHHLVYLDCKWPGGHSGVAKVKKKGYRYVKG